MVRLATPLLAACFVGAFACHSGGTAQPPGGGDASSGDGGTCVCEVPTASGNTLYACNSAVCAGGIGYLCSDGTLIEVGVCGSSGGADAAEEAPCTPTTCTNQNCGSPDGCGGICQCAPGVTCNPDQTCGNGCDLTFGQGCTVGSTTPATCCSDGYQCQAHDGGTAACCVQTGGNGVCKQSTDCCDYPAAQCDPGAGTCN